MDPHRFAYGGFTLSAVRSHALWLRSGPARAAPKHHISAALPRQIRFGLFPFRSPLLGKSLLISLPRGTKMLQFPRFDLRRKRGGVRRSARCSFGNLGIAGYVRLPRAYRSLSRPSSLLKPSNPPIGVFTLAVQPHITRLCATIIARGPAGPPRYILHTPLSWRIAPMVRGKTCAHPLVFLRR